jgi:voltage-gated potassium channel
MLAPSGGLRSRLGWPALLLVLVVAYGTAGYSLIEGWTLLDALYMTVLTLTTVGFMEVHPLDATGRIFTITVMIMGVGLVLVTLSLVAGWVADGGLGQRTRRRRMERHVNRLSDHFIVCAYGRVGRSVVREFEGQGVPYLVVEERDDIEEQMITDGVPYLVGDSSQESVLRAAGVERAAGLICAVDSDATNVYIALTARSINPGLFIVARASDPGSVDRLHKAGADRVISPYVTSGRHMAVLALRPAVVDYIEVGGGVSSLRLEEVRVDPGSDLVGRTVGEVCGRALPLALRHATGEVSAHPDAGIRLQPGDLMVLLGEDEVLRPVEGARRRPPDPSAQRGDPH